MASCNGNTGIGGCSSDTAFDKVGAVVVFNVFLAAAFFVVALEVDATFDLCFLALCFLALCFLALCFLALLRATFVFDAVFFALTFLLPAFFAVVFFDAVFFALGCFDAALLVLAFGACAGFFVTFFDVLFGAFLEEAPVRGDFDAAPLDCLALCPMYSKWHPHASQSRYH